MKKPRKLDYKPKDIFCAEDMVKWYENYINHLEEYVKYLEIIHKDYIYFIEVDKNQ